jgi:hypothetical protein
MQLTLLAPNPEIILPLDGVKHEINNDLQNHLPSLVQKESKLYIEYCLDKNSDSRSV